MTVTERAAKVWAALERHLIERCGLPDGHMLDVNRPYLIRWIGERLKAVPVDVHPQPAQSAMRSVRIDRLDDSQPANTATRHLPHLRNLLDDSALALTFKSTKTVGQKPAFHDPRLAAMLERSCSLGGYEQEETVTFDPK